MTVTTIACVVCGSQVRDGASEVLHGGFRGDCDGMMPREEIVELIAGSAFVEVCHEAEDALFETLDSADRLTPWLRDEAQRHLRARAAALAGCIATLDRALDALVHHALRAACPVHAAKRPTRPMRADGVLLDAVSQALVEAEDAGEAMQASLEVYRQWVFLRALVPPEVRDLAALCCATLTARHNVAAVVGQAGARFEGRL